MTILISNLDLQMTNEELKKLFEAYGEVVSAEIAVDSFTDKPRGFGHIEMKEDAEGEKAVAELNNSELKGQKLSLKKTEPVLSRKGSYKVGNGAIQAYRFRKN